VSILQQLAAVATIGQLIVIGAGAYFAFRQIDRLRRQQEAELVQSIFATLNAPEFATALNFVYNDLSKRLNDAAYLREIAEGRATAASHPEFVVMHFFNGLGLLVHSKMVGEYPIVLIVASPAINARFRSESVHLNAQWKETARELVEKQFKLLDGEDSAAIPDSYS
jgi:hypothetical protein